MLYGNIPTHCAVSFLKKTHRPFHFEAPDVVGVDLSMVHLIKWRWMWGKSKDLIPGITEDFALCCSGQNIQNYDIKLPVVITYPWTTSLIQLSNVKFVWCLSDHHNDTGMWRCARSQNSTKNDHRALYALIFTKTKLMIFPNWRNPSILSGMTIVVEMEKGKTHKEVRSSLPPPKKTHKRMEGRSLVRMECSNES